MSSIVNGMYSFNTLFKSAEYDKELISINSELDEITTQMDKWSEKKSEIDEAKNNKEFYSIFDLKECERQIRFCEIREKTLEQKKMRIENANEIAAAQHQGFKNGQKQDASYEFSFSFK